MAELLFNYGSNHPGQLTDRIGPPKRMFAAYAPGYMRVFRGWSNNWGGGVASLKAGKRRPAYGYVAEITKAQLERMDKFEGVASGNYSRKKIKVVLDHGDTEEETTVWAYVSNSTEFNEPSRKYLEAVVKTINTFWEIDGPDDITVEDDIVRRNPSNMRYYFITRRGSNITAYGPFADKRDAQVAGYFYKSVAERDEAASSGRLRVHIGQGVSAYDDEEIQAIKRSPSEFGYKSFSIKNANAVPMDSSWEEIDSRLYIMNKDFEAADDNPGLAAGRHPSEFDPKQLVMGIEVEMEHTSSRRKAERIAMDHLVEDPRYYTKLKKAGL